MGQRLGQHFLRDVRVLDAILSAARIQPGQRVLEIGPGPGNLTERLSVAVGPRGKVVAIEADRLLAHGLKGRFANVEVVVGDAVKVDLATVGGGGRFDHIVANLPYLISGPISVAFLELLRDPATRWGDAVLMYQREFAERLLASPGTKDYGRLTVHAARWWRADSLIDVPPAAFDPPPQVDSMVIRLTPHPVPPFAVADEALWTAIVDGAFQQRRKKMRNTVPPAVAGRVPKETCLAALDGLGLSDLRPEDVPAQDYARLVERLVGSPA